VFVEIKTGACPRNIEDACCYLLAMAQSVGRAEARRLTIGAQLRSLHMLGLREGGGLLQTPIHQMIESSTTMFVTMTAWPANDVSR
jgi:hypothetical protein